MIKSVIDWLYRLEDRGFWYHWLKNMIIASTFFLGIVLLILVFYLLSVILPPGILLIFVILMVLVGLTLLWTVLDL